MLLGVSQYSGSMATTLVFAVESIRTAYQHG